MWIYLMSSSQTNVNITTSIELVTSGSHWLWLNIVALLQLNTLAGVWRWDYNQIISVSNVQLQDISAYTYYSFYNYQMLYSSVKKLFCNPPDQHHYFFELPHKGYFNLRIMMMTFKIYRYYKVCTSVRS